MLRLSAYVDPQFPVAIQVMLLHPIQPYPHISFMCLDTGVDQ